MEVVRVKDSDIQEISCWRAARGKVPFEDGWLPETGFMVPNILAAFVYKTDSKLAFFEGVIASPDTTHEERQEALGLVGDAIISWARENGFKYLQGSTAIASVARVSASRGFRVTENKYALLILEIL